MSLELRAEGLSDAIGPHEEFLFALAETAPDRYPTLLSVWSAFYSSPLLSPKQAGDLVHELIDLLAANGGVSNKALAVTVFRLLPFFSHAFRGGLEVRCISD